MKHMDAWNALKEKARLFPSHPNNINHKTLSSSNITLNYNAQNINKNILSNLFQLAKEAHVEEKIAQLFSTHPVNHTEKRPALHWALRASRNQAHQLNDTSILDEIDKTRLRMQTISEKLRNKTWVGYTGKPITDIINLGIGGSHLGPFFCLHALAEFKSSQFNYHFISDFDPDAFANVTASLNPETTLFIASSKSFTTRETLYNLKKAIDWLGPPNALETQLIAVTATKSKAEAFGIKEILPIWDWVGGRYSVCSAINLITCIAIGFERFQALLNGAASMDAHFQNTALESNLPVHLALLGIWNNNFLNIHQLLILTYGQRLDYFTAYVQQLDMESNGKTIDTNGKPVDYATGPIVWGGSGNQAQHSYYQLLCQGTHHIAADFISVESQKKSLIHTLCLAQKKALSVGATNTATSSDNFIREHTAINHLSLKDTSPETIGALIALYEHKIYTQSVIWQINPFDQPGVESSKRLMSESEGAVYA